MITEAYSDGGVIQRNPSPLGGTYGWCHVDERDERVAKGSGYVLPEYVASLCTGHETGVAVGVVSNNLTEMLAMVLAMEALPDGWSGTVKSDSGITIGRVRSIFDVVVGRAEYTHKLEGIPAGLRERVYAQAARLGDVSFSLLAGHPKADDLRRGYKIKQRSSGEEYHVPVSRHNVLCDKLCNAAVDLYRVDRLRLDTKGGGVVASAPISSQAAPAGS